MMNEVGVCADSKGNVAILYTDGEKYYRNPPTLDVSLDQASETINGHTNWAFYDTLTSKEKKDLEKNDVVVVFYKKKE